MADFPFKAGYLPPASEMFEALRAEKLPQWGQTLVRQDSDHERVDALSSHFSEEQRVQAEFKGGPSPLARWKASGAPPAADVRAAREAVYASGREANSFNPVLARWVMELAGGAGARILDPSAGWGDRLVAALASQAACYHGFDPNPALAPAYERMIAELPSTVEARVECLPFEDAELAGKYDLVLTSPPYGDFEVYVAPGQAGFEQQSVARHPDPASWLANFYRPYLAKAYGALRPGGFFVLYVEDVRGFPLRTEAKKFLISLGGVAASAFKYRTDWGTKKGRERMALAWFRPAGRLSPPVELSAAPGGLLLAREDRLFAGTKQRAALDFMREAAGGAKQIMYSGTWDGYGAIACALAAGKLGLGSVSVVCRCGIGGKIVPGSRQLQYLLGLSAKDNFGGRWAGKVIFTADWGELVETAKRLEGPDVFWAPLGLLDPRHVELLTAALLAAWPADVPRGRVFVAVGSGLLMSALAGVFDEVVGVPACLAPKRLEKIRAVAAKFANVRLDTKAHPPVACPAPAVHGYDSKAYDAAAADGRAGDVVWVCGAG